MRQYHGIAHIVAVAKFSYSLNPSSKRMRSQFTFRVNLFAIAGHSVAQFSVKTRIKWASSDYPKMLAIWLFSIFSPDRADLCARMLILLTKNNGNKLYGDNNFLFGNCSKAISFKGSIVFFLVVYYRSFCATTTTMTTTTLFLYFAWF